MAKLAELIVKGEVNEGARIVIHASEDGKSLRYEIFKDATPCSSDSDEYISLTFA